MSSRSAWLVAFACFVAARTAHADEPDQRSIPPFVMIVADTSGSMEYLPDCTCVTDGCAECLPNCDADNSASGVAKKKNRWATLLEALTGEFTDFQCRPLARTAANLMPDGATTETPYDLGYSKPYHRPWRCTPDTASALCDYPGSIGNPLPVGATEFQKKNGLLDNYVDGIRFGLATFDGKRTYADKSDLVLAGSSFDVTQSESAPGSYSYGGYKTFRYPSCDNDYAIDSGIRGPNAPEGGLIALDSCPSPPCDAEVLNAQIQDMLLHTRTFGGTPIASALDDLYHYYTVDANDSLKSCRDRYAILITDGYPDDDFRDYPSPGCDCKTRGDCGKYESLKDTFHCPYPLATTAAQNLVQGKDTTDGAQIKRLFVVGMSVNDAIAKAKLNAVAYYGGNTVADADNNYAFFADKASSLTSTLDSLLSAIPKPISRSVPAFATGPSGTQYQISAGFKLSPLAPPTGFTTPWLGILERRRFLCGSDGALSSPDLSDEDRFDQTLNKRSGESRSLKTALPLATTDSADLSMVKGGTCGTTGCSLTELKSVEKTRFGTTMTDARLPVLLGWMYGWAGSMRETQKLGDIYHSSPAVAGQPVEDPGDQSYSLFRESARVTERPTMVYVNSNDGILHAFSLEKYPAVESARTYESYASLSLTAGQELWGFVPPLLLNDLDMQLSAHKLNLDGTPVIKDVYFSKGTTPAATDYHTVLITGMRGGGNGYIALDVTDPVKPQFLWQFTDPDMGFTYGQPEIVQAIYPQPVGQTAAAHAMVILSGGKGELGAGPGCDSAGKLTSAMLVPDSKDVFTTISDPDDLASSKIKHRSSVQCWKRTGRALYFVDVETGRLIKKIYDTDTVDSNGTIFPSPLVGSPTAFQDTVGTIATEGFVLDADGVMWRIDLNDSDPKDTDPLNGWTVRPFHDLFWDSAATAGETSFEKPILSLDESHRLVVIVGTGDTDHFDKLTALNRVVSLTEIAAVSPQKPSDYGAALNWQHMVDGEQDGMVKSELVTGEMALFQGQLFVPTFISQPDTTDACSIGRGRLWSFDYRKRDGDRENPQVTSAPSTFGPVRIAVKSDETTGNDDLSLFNVSVEKAEKNLLVLGLGTTQRLSCGLGAEDVASNYYQPTLPGFTKPTQTPALWIVGQASSDDTSRQRAGSQLSSIEVMTTRNVSFSTIASWAGSVE